MKRSGEAQLSTFLGAVPLFHVVLSSIGATGVLIGLGYIVAYSREHLLGIDITRATTTADYAAIGARFFADVIVLMYRNAADNGWLLGVVFAVMVVSLLAARRMIVLPPVRFRSVYLFAVLILLVAKIAYYDIPFVLRSDVLLLEIDYSGTVGLPKRLDRHAVVLWKDFACRHDADYKCDVDKATKNLNSFFFQNVVATAIVTYLALLFLRRNRQRSRSEAEASEPLGGLSIPLVTSFVLLVGVLAVPFTYGRAVWDARMPRVIVTFRPPQGVAATPTSGEGLNEPIKETVETSSDQIKVDVFPLLLGADDKIVLVYDRDMVIEYLRTDIDSLQMTGTGDLIGEHIKHPARKDGT